MENDQQNDSIPQELVAQGDVHILVTDEDKYGDDIMAMSDFFGGYIQQLSTAIRTEALTDVIPDIPAADLGIIGEVVNRAEVVSKGTTELIPDFDSLPNDIRQKLNEGKYKVGESRQVNGNLRAVIVDEEGTRVKDITLKEIKINPGTVEAARSISNQLQMRQIYAKLDAIQEMQNYQIARDRDRDIKVPFLDAREYILKAQISDGSPEEKKQYLKKAEEKLISATNSVYTELQTSTDHLAKLTRFPIFQRKDQITQYIGYMSEDLQVATKFVGLRVQLLDYLGESKEAKIAIERYQHIMTDFFTKKVVRGLSAAELIHSNYPYNGENMNCWYQLSTDVQPKLEQLNKNSEHVYLVSVEDEEDGTEE